MRVDFLNCFILPFDSEYMKNIFSFCIIVMVSVAILLMNLEVIMAFGISSTQDGNITAQMQEQKKPKCNYNIRDPVGYCLEVTVEGMDQEPTYVHSYALTADGISIANGSQWFGTGLEKNTLPVSLCCSRNDSVSQFYSCAVKFVDSKMCSYTMTEEEPVLINFNASGK
jgi:hypothetical protein